MIKRDTLPSGNRTCNFARGGLAERAGSLRNIPVGVRSEFYSLLDVHFGFGGKTAVPGIVDFKGIPVALAIFLLCAPAGAPLAQPLAASGSLPSLFYGLVRHSIHGRGNLPRR